MPWSTHTWYNCRTKTFDDIQGVPEDFSDYIPQSAPAQNLYNLLIETGKTSIEAALHILQFIVGGKG